MKNNRLNFSIIAVVLVFFMSGCTFTKIRKANIQNVADVSFGIIKELGTYRGKIRHDIRITVGDFYDKTKYSGVITRGSQTVLYHMLYRAFGPRMILERQYNNMRLIKDEYSLSHDYQKTPKGMKQVGLIQRGGPRGGLVGANYMITGAIVYYHVDRYSGGGGLNIDGIGLHFQKEIARVGVELRLVDMSTSEVIWSTLKESWVSGTLVGADIFRFITAGGEKFLVASDAGIAEQLPADYAFEIATANAVVDMIKENKDLFIGANIAKK